MIAYETRKELPEWKRIEHWPLYPPANAGSSGSILTMEPLDFIGLPVMAPELGARFR
jgi:hypothetical protein